MKIEKIMLATPNDRWFGLRHWHNFPYTLGILNSILRDRYDIQFLDAALEDLTPEQARERISKYTPDILGISCMSMEYTRHFQEIAKQAKIAAPETKVIVGGIYPTLLPDVIIQNPNIDYAVLGEGEYRFPKLLQHIEKPEKNPIEEIEGLSYKKDGNIIIQPIKDYIKDLDKLPFPNYEGMNIEAYMNQARTKK